MRHPRDRFITVYGRKPVLAALEDDSLALGRLLIAHTAQGGIIERIRERAQLRGIQPEHASPREVSRLSRNGRQDQGVALDVVATRKSDLAEWAAKHSGPAHLLLLDGVTTPANIGILLRSAVAANLDGVVLPRRGSPKVDSLVIKASAGAALRAPILTCADPLGAVETLQQAGFSVVGTRMESAVDLYSYEPPHRVVWVLGNETHGVSERVAQRVTEWVRIPILGPAESLNVAVAGSIIAYEAVRRR